MKILLASSNSSGIGGGERYLVYLAKGLCQLGHEVHALVGAHDYMEPIAGNLSAAGAIVRRERLIALGERRLRFVSACLDRSQRRKLVRIYREINPDVVHVNQQYDEDGLDFVLAAIRSGLPAVGVIHLPMCRNKLDRPFGRMRAAWVGGWYRRNGYLKILVSADSAREFRDFYGCEESTFQVDNATSDETNHAPPAASLPPGWPAGAPIVGFVGRLEDQKDPLLLLQAWRLLRSAMPDAKLLMVGDGSMRAEIERAASEAGLKSELHITGWEPDSRPWRKLISVLVLCSRFEGMPLSLIEAACDGLRIAAVPCPGVPGIFQHVPWAVPVASRDPVELANGIERSFASAPPTEGQLAAARTHFCVTRMARETVRVYEAAIERSGYAVRPGSSAPSSAAAGAAGRREGSRLREPFAAIRLLNIIQCSNLGGMEHSTLLALSELKERGHQCSLLSLHPVGALAGPAVEAGIPLEGLTYRGFAGWRSIAQLHRKASSYRPDRLIISGHNLAAMIAVRGICPGRRLLKVHFHHEGVRPRWHWRIIYDAALRLFPHITFCTDFIRLEAEDICPALRGVASTLRNPFQIHATVYPEDRSAARRKLGLPADARIVGNAGWLIRRKRFDIFLRTAAQVARAVPDAVFLIAGDGPRRSFLQGLAAELGIAGRVRWLGWQEDTERFYESLDVLLFCSDWDALGRTAPEAMSFGVPVVASVNHGGLGELIQNEEHGFLISTHDIGALSRQIVRLLDSPDQARQIGLAGRERLAAWSPPGQHAEAICRMLDLK